MLEIDYVTLEECMENEAELKKLLDEITSILDKEEKFLVLKKDTYTIVGDIHGDFTSLKYIIENTKNNRIIFLGDYIDRGDHQLESIITVFLLKIKYPDKVFLLRGNHEPLIGLEPYPHDFPMHLIRFKDWISLYKKFLDVFQKLPYTILIEDSAILLHGGLPVDLKDSIFEYFEVGNPSEKLLEQILWNDPTDDVDFYIHNPRGAGYLFGEIVTKHALKISNTKILIRGHEACSNGYKFNHGKKVLTIFSRKGKPYFNRFAAFLEINFNENKWYENIESYIKTF